MNKRKILKQSLKQNLTQFTWNKLFYSVCSSKTNIWACCYSKAWIAWLCWACICWFCIMCWLCYLSQTCFSFFPSCKSSDLNSRSFSSFLEENQPLRTATSTLFFIISVTFILYLTFSCFSKFFKFFFSQFIEFSIFCFLCQTAFFEYLLPLYVAFLQISL